MFRRSLRHPQGKIFSLLKTCLLYGCYSGWVKELDIYVGFFTRLFTIIETILSRSCGWKVFWIIKKKHYLKHVDSVGWERLHLILFRSVMAIYVPFSISIVGVRWIILVRPPALLLFRSCVSCVGLCWVVDHLVGKLELKLLAQRNQIFLVFSRVVQSLIPTFAVDVAMLVNCAQGRSLWN
jgi:hypothetical protein